MNANPRATGRGDTAAWLLLLLPLLLPALLQAGAVAPTEAEDRALSWRLAPLLAGPLIAAGLGALCGRWRWLLPVLALGAWLAPLEAGYLWQFGMPSGAPVYGVIAETNREEALAWLGPALPIGLLLMLGWALPLLWALRRLWRADPRWRHRSRWWVGGGFLLVSATALALDRLNAQVDAQLQAQHERLAAPGTGHLTGADAVDSAQALHRRLESSYPWGLPQRLWRWQRHRQALAGHAQAVAGHAFAPRPTADAAAISGPQVHVLVIGEASRPDRWSLYGAARDTTPRLRQRPTQQLLRFDDAVSAASATRESLVLMLTRRPPDDLLAPVREPSVIGAFRQAGFKTYWFSTQGAAGGHETPVSAMAAEADQREYLNAADYRSAGAHDGALLPRLAAVLARREPKVLVVLHTLGSHLHYAHRYPPEFEHFRPALTKDEQANVWTRDRLAEMLNAYDNSLRYTDHVLAEAIGLLERSGAAATLLYAADHGETFWDGQCSSGGHGFAAIANYRIPMLLWASAPWRGANAARWQRLQQRRDQPVSTLALFETLNALGGFEVNARSGHRDLGASDWRPAAREIAYYGDFDRQLQRLACDRLSPSAASAAAAAAGPAATSAGRGGTR